MRYILAIISPFAVFILNASQLNIELNTSQQTNKTTSKELVQNEFALIKPIAIEEAPPTIEVIPDSDGDGILDDADQCPNTPKGVRVDKLGCEIKFDTDRDGIADADDECPNSEIGIKVDKFGCAVKYDKDFDGIIDDDDECPNTTRGVIVDKQGCELDSDGDGIVDSEDQCPNTGVDFSVDGYGCPQVATIRLNFGNNDFSVTDEIVEQLADFAQFLKDNRGYKLIIYGFTDNIGSEEDNLVLSTNRAIVVKSILMRYGIQESRMSTVGKGESEPVADNSTKEGRAQNRRIEIELIQ